MAVPAVRTKQSWALALQTLQCKINPHFAPNTYRSPPGLPPEARRRFTLPWSKNDYLTT